MEPTEVKKNNNTEQKDVRPRPASNGMKHTIDATNQKMGRLASKIAAMLLGKTTPAFKRNEVAEISVEVLNASKMSIAPKKKEDTIYNRYSGYPGGLRHESMKQIIEKKGYGAILQEAVYGMLPGNKLRGERMKRLTISE